MQYGVCGDTDIAAIAAQASYDYMEWGVTKVLKPQESEEAFRETLDMLRTMVLPYPVCNGFVPGELKITGPDVDAAALRDYVGTSMRRAEQAGVETIVFGSGGARRIPDGFDAGAAHDQLVSFCRMVAPLAYDHGVTVVVEPLNTAECNVLTTVDECAQLVLEVDHPGVRLLVDAYHLMRDSDSLEDVVKHGALLRHVHIATTANRRAPGAERCDFAAFFRALAAARYTGRISIEARLSDPETELPMALSELQKLAANHGGNQAEETS